MAIIRHQHHGDDAAHEARLLKGWPDDCLVQWGGSGLVIGAGGSRTTAFFEAFPEGGGFIRGEGADLAEAEKNAFRQFLKETGCAHEWSRKSYRNQGGICRHCGSFQLVFHEIVELGAWRTPLRAMELDAIMGGSCYPRPGDDASMTKWRRRMFLRGLAAGIVLPDPTDYPGIMHPFDNPYATACSEAVCEWMHKGGAPASSRGKLASGIESILAGISGFGVREKYEKWLANIEIPTEPGIGV